MSVGAAANDQGEDAYVVIPEPKPIVLPKGIGPTVGISMIAPKRWDQQHLPDRPADTDGSFGAALAHRLARAKGAGKTGWRAFAAAMEREGARLSTWTNIRNDGQLGSHGTSRAATLLGKSWPVKTSPKTIRNHIERLGALRKKLARVIAEQSTITRPEVHEQIGGTQGQRRAR
jgi:hypothetical protein